MDEVAGVKSAPGGTCNDNMIMMIIMIMVILVIGENDDNSGKDDHNYYLYFHHHYHLDCLFCFFSLSSFALRSSGGCSGGDMARLTLGGT